MPKYSNAAHKEFLRMCGRIDIEWQSAIPMYAYRSTEARKVLLRLWQSRRMKVVEVYVLLPELSQNTQRKWVRQAIKDGALESDDVPLVEAIQAGKEPEDHRGKRASNVWLSTEWRSHIDRFMDGALDEALRAVDHARENALV